jgi:hypothetical protein
MAPVPLVLLLAGLTSCSSVLTEGTSAAAGIAGAGLANAVTDNGAVTAGIGLGVLAAARAGVQYAQKRVHGAEQAQIARAAGPLPPGSVTAWAVSHDLPIESDEHGQVAVSRVIVAGGPAALDCKEIVFSVDTVEKKVPRRAFYTAAICRNGETWQWASAEPATERWGALQ